MGNRRSGTTSLSSDQHIKKKSILVPPLFGCGCDVWSTPPSRPSMALPPFRTHLFSTDVVLKNHILFEPCGDTSSVLSNLLLNPLAVCAPGMALLSREHLKVGLWHSASTPTLDGQVITSYSHHDSVTSDDKRIKLHVIKLFLSPVPSFNDCDLIGGIDLRLNAPINPKVRYEKPNGAARAFYQYSLDDNAGNFVLSASMHHGKDTEHTHVTTGLQYTNKLLYAQSKLLVLSVGTTFRSIVPSLLQTCDTSSSSLSTGSAYLVGNFVRDGFLAGVQIHHSSRDYWSSIPSIGKHHWKSAFHKYIQTPTSSNDLRLSYLFSLDLNRINNIFSKEPSPSSSLDSPIVITAHNVHTDDRFQSSAAITVSQIIFPERIIMNPLEDRGPQIRNAVSWAIQIGTGQVKHINTDDSTESQGATENLSLRAAAAWQLNRNICTKVHYDAEGMTCGVIMKRWVHPRITSSILFAESKNSANKVISGFRFKGLCIQVETGPLVQDAENNSYDANRYLYRVDAATFGVRGDGNESTHRRIQHSAPTIVEYVRT